MNSRTTIIVVATFGGWSVVGAQGTIDPKGPGSFLSANNAAGAVIVSGAGAVIELAPPVAESAPPVFQ